MVDYFAMKRLPRLAFLWLLMAPTAWAQGVRMSADFLPLDVGNKWTYDVTGEDGQKAGQIAFAVEDYTIVSGRSFYVLTGFPFAGESGDRIRLVRYDRQERQFIRMLGSDEGALFLQDGATAEVLEADSSNIPQKILLDMGSVALIFQRGIGIVEARQQTPRGIQIARIAGVAGKALTSTGGASAAAAAPAAPDPLTPLPSTAEAVRRVENVTEASETNPRVEVGSSPVAGGHRFTLVAANTSDKLLPLRFNSGQSYDFVVTERATGREVWRWSKEQFFTSVVRTESIRPNARWTFEAVWNHVDGDGNTVSPGAYEVTGIVTSNPPIPSPRTVFDVQ